LVKRARAMVPPGESIDPVVVEPHKQSNEVGRIIMDAQNLKLKPEGKFVGQVTIIMDCDGLTLGHFWGPALELLKANSTMDQKYFPEGMHKCYVANAPKFIKVGWAIVRLWLDAGSQKKVEFLAAGDQTRNALLAAIDAEHLPAFLGGSCTCEGECVPLPAMTGPEDEGEEQTIEMQVAARSKKTHVVAVQAGNEVKWQWTSTGGNDIGFSVLYKALTGDETEAASTGDDGIPVVPAAKLKESQGSFAAPGDGAVTFVFDNTYSWMKGKELLVRVSATGQS
jgi:hypothetical protein